MRRASVGFQAALVTALFAALLAAATASPTSAATEADVMRTFAATPAGMHPFEVAYEANAGLVLVVTAESDPDNPNSLVAFDPIDGSTAWVVGLGGVGLSLAVSADGSTAYVGVLSGGVLEVDLPTQATRVLDLGANSCSGGTRGADDIEVVPGDASSIVVTSWGSCNEVFLMASGVVASGIVGPLPRVVQLSIISESEVIGHDVFGTCSCHHRFSIDSDGVELVSSPTVGVISRAITAVGGAVYHNDGRSIDVSTGALIRRFGSFLSFMSPLVDGDVVYFGNESERSNSLAAFDLSTGAPLGQPIWLASNDEIEGVVVTPAGLVVWGSLRFDAEGTAPPVELHQFGVQVLVDIAGTGFEIITDEPIEMCVEIYDADTEALIAEGETVQNQVTFELPQTLDIKILAWDCNRWGLFPTWYGDSILVDFDGATTVVLNELPGNLRIAMDPFFVDVPFDAFYFGPTVFLRNTGITTGCGSLFYCPNDNVTRAQMASFVARFWRLLGGECSSDSSFVDVPAGAFFSLDVGCIADIGVTTGTSPTTYSPGGLVTREQMAAFVARLYRAFGFECPDGGHPFTDVAATSFANRDIACIFILGITNGTSATTYGPAQPVTRAQMAAFLDRLFDAVTA